MPRRLALGLLVLLATHAAAQTTASLSGIVTAAGKPASGARVALTSPALQGERQTLTGENGAYAFAALPPGEYDITFAGATTKRARLQLAQTTRVDAEIATTSEAITVEAPLESHAVATTLALEDVEQLPVQRNQLATAALAPGVSANVVSNGTLLIAGGPSYDNLVLVNGVVVTENTRGQIRPMYVEDAIQETTVLTGAVTAEYSRFTGGVVNTITKSGGDVLSGSVRDSLSNPRWSARTPANEEREDNLNHVFETTLGGAAIRERLWFFGAGRWAKNDTARQTIAVPGAPAPVSYTESNDQKRYEAKLTGRISDAHTLVGSYFGIDTTTENSRSSNNVYDLASLMSRDEPESLAALRYDGVVNANLLFEAQLSRRRMALQSGATTRDLVGGTLMVDRGNANARFHAPALCGVCASEQRNNDDVLLKTNLHLDGLLGTHDVVAGVDRFEEQHLLDDHQSGSDFTVFVTRTQFANGEIYPIVTPTNANGGGTFIRWTPVLIAARENELRTDSAFVNDTWTIGPRWNVSLGLRYDRNHAVDADGTLTANDRRISPRLSVQYDLRGDGRQRVSASYAEYASRIGDAIASANQTAGAAASIDFAYKGAPINDKALTVPLPEVLAVIFAQLEKQGGTSNTSAANLRPNGTRDIPGYSAYFDGTLATPYVREMTLGYGTAIGARGFVRADLVARDWRDFYTASVTRDTRRTTTPLGIPVDLALMRNTNDIERTYRALLLQARWNPSRYDMGLHYTYAKLRGNDEGESANLDPALYYPELLGYARNNPVGWLQGDQRHRVRAWIDADLGAVHLSLLQTYDSGLPYSITAPINVTRYEGAPANPGYNAIPNGRYFISDRGALRTDAITSTNLGIRYARGIFFAQADVLNLFGEDGIADPQRLGSGVSTAANANTLETFNPFTTTPVEGKHYTLAPNFGKPLNNLAYQPPRTFRTSVGLRF